MNYLKNRQGFTLIEMLVVVGIIGVLASLVLVGLGGARDAGADAKRISNLNQIRNSLELYYLRSGSYPDNPPLYKVEAIPGIDKGKIDFSSDNYFYEQKAGSYLIGVTLKAGSAQGVKEGTVNGNDCVSQTFYCLTSE
ncbi:MAG: hypothetical protein COV57_00355 [Candidatus Liptonbacteria bacterium CG11_big_fil_rev_8_21_14_0_20_35_14]|uniref:Type II secretion system protein GspG C-terminal domain-containing protein n=1 Tax=Candidatus Liptonbacteria bacterium CG11_big_fil_rev_8_21_14_0_20_35_14 TaxID=1974634 RepID=A0A2H0N8J5_9BACT|nr:MAG: hypothetical protein COV57_00355 [Candidatus Liptonbacteria bacterium CG11_big_fil_rev_8_21_14_0_20_35_14]